MIVTVMASKEYMWIQQAGPYEVFSSKGATGILIVWINFSY